MDPHTISEVDTVCLEAPLDEPFGYSQEWVETRTATLVRIETEDGTVGWGECWGPSAGTRGVVEDLFAPELRGRDPLQVERIHDDLYDQGRAAYQSIVPLPAISGIDIALWDLKGKLLDQPVSSLLGGRARDSLRAYGTGHYFRHTTDLDVQYDEIVEEAVENARRFDGIKLKVGLDLIGYGPDEDVELVRRVRDAVGKDTEIMVDANYAYTRPTARRVGRGLEALDVHWFEEPVKPEDLDGYAALREALDVHVAGGECHTPADLHRLFSMNGLDIAQPDLGNVGGITPTTRIASRAAQEGIELYPHVWGTPVALAASLQFASTLQTAPWLEFDSSPNPLREEVATTPITLSEDGTVPVPDGPGLGVDLDPDAIEAYRVD